MDDRFEKFIVPSSSYSMGEFSDALNKFIEEINLGVPPNEEEVDSLSMALVCFCDNIMQGKQLFEENKSVIEVEMWLKHYCEKLNSTPHRSKDLNGLIDLIIKSIGDDCFNDVSK